MLLVLVPVASAQTDDWYVDNAIDGVCDLHPEIEAYRESILGSVTTGYHWHGVGQHKHVELSASFGYQDTGYFQSEGRVYTNTELGHEAGDYFEWDSQAFYYSRSDSPKLKWTIHHIENCDDADWVDGGYVPNPQLVINLRDNDPDGRHKIHLLAVDGTGKVVWERDTTVSKNQKGVTYTFPARFHDYTIGYRIN